MPELKEFIYALIRQRLSEMIRKSFETLNESAEFMPNWHINALTHSLENCETGKITRLIVAMPPRYMKSEISSVAFPTWLLGRDPTKKIICASYADELGRTFARGRRTIMEASWYRKSFPGTKISNRKNTETEVVTTRGGGCFTTSVGGTLTGRGADIIIIDDPIKAGSAMSNAERKAVNEWFRNTLYSRLNDKRKGVIIIVMQRTHVADLAGFVQELDDWEILKLPAIATENETINTGHCEEDRYHRKAGEPLHEARESLETLARIEKAIGSRNFGSQYQQAPVPRSGSIILRDWIKRCGKIPASHEFDAVYQSWDTASAVEERNSFSVCTTWGVRAHQYHLIDVFRDRLKFPDLVRAAQKLASRYRPQRILIEKASNGEALIAQLKELGQGRNQPPGKRLPPIENINVSTSDKATRLEAASIYFERGQVFLPERAPWLEQFEDELFSFPDGLFNDQVDSTSQFLNWINDPNSGGRNAAIAHNSALLTIGGHYFGDAKRKPHPMRNPKKRR
jgi:predicted phage terminase large subunit-like protein